MADGEALSEAVVLELERLARRAGVEGLQVTRVGTRGRWSVARVEVDAVALADALEALGGRGR